MSFSRPPEADSPSAGGTVRRVVMGDGVAGRLDRALADALPDLSRSRLRALIDAGHVSEGGRTIEDASLRVKPGQSFDIFIPDPEAAEPMAQAIAIDVLFEDASLLVVDKPAGLVVHPAAGNPDHTLVNALLAHCGDSLSGIGGVLRPGIVHRLDKDTSGLMVVAKNDRAHAALSAQFADRTLSRTYHAVVRGAPPRPEGEVEAAIGRSPRNRQKMAVTERGKPALTRYRVLRRFGPPTAPVACLVECRLATGRTHQIRVHMAHVGAPLIGDPLYGRGARRGDAAATREFPRQALHAVALKFVHPETGLVMEFTSKLPADIAGLLTSLESFETDYT